MLHATSDSNVVPFTRPEGHDRSDGPDLALYDSHLVKFGLTPAQREEFLKALWTLISGFIDLGYGHHPTQHADITDEINAAILRTATEDCKKAA